MTCREDDDLVVLFGCFEALVYVWTNVDACLDRLALAELHADWQVVGEVVDVIDTMDKRLIQVKYDRLPKWRWWQHHTHLVQDLRVRRCGHLHIMK